MKPGVLALAFAGACCLASSGWAAESLHLAQAVERSLAQNPSLSASRSDLDAVKALAARESMSPQFVLTGEFENFGGTGETSGTRSAEATLRLGRTIELGGKQKARRDLGNAQIAQQDNALALARISITSTTTSRFIAVLAEQERIALLAERIKLADRTRREVAGWVTAGRNPDSDLHTAEIALAEAKLAHTNALLKLKMAKMTLASSWGATRVDFGDVAGNIRTLPPVQSLEKLNERLPETLAFQNANLETGTLSAKKQLAVSSSTPDIDLSLGVRRLENNDHALVFAASIPLGTDSRARHAIAEANAQLVAAQSRRQAFESEASQLLFSTYQELIQARQEYELLSNSMIPKAKQALAVSQKGFQRGRFSFLILAQAQNTLFDLRKRSIDAAERYHTLYSGIERLTATEKDKQS